jgi:hypothetical protein
MEAVKMKEIIVDMRTVLVFIYTHASWFMTYVINIKLPHEPRESVSRMPRTKSRCSTPTTDCTVVQALRIERG